MTIPLYASGTLTLLIPGQPTSEASFAIQREMAPIYVMGRNGLEQEQQRQNRKEIVGIAGSTKIDLGIASDLPPIRGIFVTNEGLQLEVHGIEFLDQPNQKAWVARSITKRETIMNQKLTIEDVYAAAGLQDPWEYMISTRTKLLTAMRDAGTSFLDAANESNRRTGRTTYLVAQAVVAASEGFKPVFLSPFLAIDEYMKDTFEKMCAAAGVQVDPNGPEMQFTDHTAKEFSAEFTKRYSDAT